MLFKEIVDGRTPDIEGSQKLTEHFVLRWAKNWQKHFNNFAKRFIQGSCLCSFIKLEKTKQFV